MKRIRLVIELGVTTEVPDDFLSFWQSELSGYFSTGQISVETFDVPAENDESEVEVESHD